jgi:hypothetical protein
MTLLTNAGPRASAGDTDPPSASEGKAIRGEVRFVSAEERTGIHGAVTPRGLLAVEISDPPWFQSRSLGARRGKLRDAIEWAIESALEANDAPPAGMSDSGDLDQDLSDQLFRARAIGARGLALYFPHLAPAGSLAGALDAEDSAVLRWWMAATSERPVVVLLDTANRSVGAYGPPTRLERLVETSREIDLARTTVPPPAVEETTSAQPAAVEPIAVETVAVEEPLVVEVTEPVAVVFAEPLVDDEPVAVEEPAEGAIEPEVAAAKADEPPPPPKAPVASSTKRMFADRVVPLFPRREVLPAKSPAFVEKGRAVAASLDWRGFANELEVARGPKPLTIVERLFMSRYMPLCEAIEQGEADEAAARTAERWAENFSRSYIEGFNALKITGKRPRMVLDAPQLGSQIARLHGAKSTQLVLVDAMRFDLGVRVHDRMRDALTSQATCTERLLLWSALPTTTPTQLELLARGPEALASRVPPSDREEPGLRGKTSATLRRIKIGSRDLMKLDLVETRIRESGPPLAERLDVIAEEVAVALSAHARSLPPRTLMFVFGDHGFRMESSDDGGTLPGSSGGASPEEVLVPAFAWLVGDVH